MLWQEQACTKGNKLARCAKLSTAHANGYHLLTNSHWHVIVRTSGMSECLRCCLQTNKEAITNWLHQTEWPNVGMPILTIDPYNHIAEEKKKTVSSPHFKRREEKDNLKQDQPYRLQQLLHITANLRGQTTPLSTAEFLWSLSNKQHLNNRFI